MAIKSGARLPPPPAELSDKRLPIKLVKGAIYRIHLAELDCIFFGKEASQRFDDPLGRYGVLYAALRPEAAFAEIFLRHLSLMLVSELDLQERALGEIECARLRCVDLSAAGLRRVSCDNRIATEKPYHTTQSWSRAFYEHPERPDGIIYRSRHNPQFKCLALFERCKPRLKLKGRVA